MPPTQDITDRAYHASMARLCSERGFPTLAEAHMFRARFIDCPPGCQCSGCVLTRAEAKEAREKRGARGVQRKGRVTA